MKSNRRWLYTTLNYFTALMISIPFGATLYGMARPEMQMPITFFLCVILGFLLIVAFFSFSHQE